MNEPRASIILRSCNEAWALRHTLPALAAQNYRASELIVFDSGSTDGSLEMIQAARPDRLVHVTNYNPSRVMNHAMRLATSEFCVFLNADATPRDDQWLRPLLRTLLEPNTAAVFGRQVPRDGCRAVFACDYERCFGEHRQSAAWPHFFSMVSSGLRKSVWERRGFLESLQYAEDHEYTQWCQSQGYKVRYCPASVVIHSHNYTPRQAYRRSFGDARALAASAMEKPRFGFWRTLVLGWFSDLRHDLIYCQSQRRMRELPHAAVIRLMQRGGKLRGARHGWRERT